MYLWNKLKHVAFILNVINSPKFASSACSKISENHNSDIAVWILIKLGQDDH